MISLKTKKDVKEHFDLASPYYQDLWGIHIHHGLFTKRGMTKEQAQEELLKLVVQRLGLKKGGNVLDIGCGIGGSASGSRKGTAARSPA